MTHDELLDKLNLVWDRDPEETQWELIEKLRNALRAVVELHRQDQWGEECQHCDNGSYPCDTIQAIEKELT